MLSGPTLWIVFVVNFIALGLVWTYVARSYPDFRAARYWGAAVFTAAAAALFGRLTLGQEPPIALAPLLAAGCFLIFACCLTAMGIQRFYGRPVTWSASLLITVTSAAGMAVFIVFDNMPMRILIYSLGQSIPIVMTLPLLSSKSAGRVRSGARLAAVIGATIVSVHMLRAACALLDIGGVSYVNFSPLQSVLLLALVFLSMMWNCGFLLMAIDRLRNEVADLALLDDLTGAANRRQLLARLDEECARSDRTQQPFALLLIDLDAFKDINDHYGHGAGDECLRTFTRAVQSQLRTGDLLARMGGDEFCVVLPSTTLREAAVIARLIVSACREQHAMWRSLPIMMSASVGVAQWRRDIGRHPGRLLEAGDQALYLAKKNGKNGYALEDDAGLAEPLQRIA